LKGKERGKEGRNGDERRMEDLKSRHKERRERGKAKGLSGCKV
jgi:hypothetical protein